MISLSREWASLSRAMYGQEFIDELADFLRHHNIKTILECGCGDGYILHGLAEKGFSGMGMDGNQEMIALALQNTQHPNIKYKQMNWLDISQLKEQFDCVMCRGNSLSHVASWDMEESCFKPELAKENLEKSIKLFFERLKSSGLLYIDTISSAEIALGNRDIKLNFPNIQMGGRIEHFPERRIRKTYGEGVVNGEFFKGGTVSYLLTPNELEETVRSFNPKRIWSPEFKHEKNYQVICAQK